jgi:long-chain acyl-CoA synthetase
VPTATATATAPAAATAQRIRFPPSAPAHIRTLAELPAYVARTHQRDALLLKCTASGTVPLSTAEFVRRGRAVALALRDMGIAPGDRVAIMSETRQEWVVADVGITTSRAVTVPIYPTLSAQQARYILQDSESRGVFVADAQQASKILEVRHLLPALEFVVVFSPHIGDPAVVPSHSIMTFDAVIDRGDRLANNADNVKAYEAAIAAVQPDDLLTIIYTSGTTGEPKGVMLSHANLVSNLLATSPILALSDQDVALSYLPLSHVFERMVTYVYLYEGVTVAHAESMETIARDLQQVRPTVMTGVPRVYEKLYTRIHEAVASGSAIKQRLFHWAVRVGTEISRRRIAGESIPGGMKVQWTLADKLVASKIRARVGGRLRLAVSGSAPLPAYIAEFFNGIGLRLIEGYGLTETSPVITVNPLDRPRFGTVGCVIDGVEVKIADDGEILTRGPHVMQGYWRRPDDTNATIVDGWFHTGDVGAMSDDGYLTITDRKKELLVTSGGKKIAPSPIEAQLKRHALVAEAVLVGEGRKFPAVLIVPDFPALEQRLKTLNLPVESREKMVERADVRSLYQEVVDGINSELARYEQLKKIALLPAEFTIEGGELTPTMKLRRKRILDDWKSVVDRLYEEERNEVSS